MRIDAHQHFWKAARGDYHWMNPAVPLLRRDYLPKDLQPALAKHAIDRTILVQAAQTVPETDFLLDLAAQHPFIAGVVGWLDLESPSFAADFKSYRAHRKFIGLRPMLQDLPDDKWILRPRVVDALKLVAEHDFPFEFLTYTRHLPHVLKVLEQVPGLRAVIDHVSKPEIRHQVMEPWSSLMAEVAKYPNVWCKVSGMVTEADHRHWNPQALAPYVHHVLNCFGPQRLLFGSDWPVCLLAGSYDQVIGALESILTPCLSAEQKAALFGGNAARFYKLI